MPDQDLRTVTKRELVNRIAEETGQTKVVVRDVLQRFLDSVIDELSVGNRLEFRDFGVFEVRERAARVAQNPRTLEKVPVPAKRVVKFKVGRVMRQRVCEDLEPAAGSDGEAARPAGTPPWAPRNGSATGSARDGDPSSGNKSHQGEMNGGHGAADRPENEDRKPKAPTPPPAKPGSPF